MTYAFGIGQTVCHKLRPEQPLLIVERLEQECPGGVQRHYECRWFGPTATGVQSFNEIELELYVLPTATRREILQAAKEALIALQDFDAAHGIRKLMESLEASNG